MMSDELHINRILSGYLPQTNARKLVLLTGARQTGKTTLVKKAYPRLKYLNLDSPEHRDTLKTIDSDLWAANVGNAVIDEAQKEPVVFEKVKYAFDESAISFTVLLGSSQILLLKRIRESLAGRVTIYELWPLMMLELAAQTHSVSKELIPLFDALITAKDANETLRQVAGIRLNKYEAACVQAEQYLLEWGGMPALLPLSQEERWQWLKDYEYTYLERDLGDLARLNDLMPFRKFQRLCALRSGKLLSYSEIARDTGVSVDTARRYIEYLRLSYQVILLQPYYENLTSSVIKTPKLYWLDIGLLRQLSGFKEGISGELYETLIISEMHKWIKTARREADLYFYRTRSGMEVDALIETSHGVIGIEVKARSKVVKADIRSLKELAGSFKKKKWLAGIIIYRGKEIKEIEPNIWVVPGHRLFT